MVETRSDFGVAPQRVTVRTQDRSSGGTLNKAGAADTAAGSETHERHWWLALAVFRWVSLGYAFVIFARTTDDYVRPTGAALVLAVMAAWTLAAVLLYRDPARRRWPLLAVDLAVAVLAVLSTGYLQSAAAVASGAQTLAGHLGGGTRHGVGVGVRVVGGDSHRRS